MADTTFSAASDPATSDAATPPLTSKPGWSRGLAAVFVAAVGLGIGSLAGLILALLTGLIDIGC